MKISDIKRTTNHPLNNNSKLKAIKRYLNYGLLRKLTSAPLLHNYIGDINLIIRKGQSSAELQVFNGLNDFNEMGFLLHFLRKNDVFVDVGANVGVYSLLAAFREAKVHSFEPVPSTFNYLKQNVQINYLNELFSLHNIGVADENTTLKITDKMDAINHIDNSDGDIEIDVKTLDSVLDGCCPNAVKIDVEGYETKVINGADSILKNKTLKAIIIELNGLANRYGFNEMGIHSTLLELGFFPCNYYPYKREIEQLSTFNKEGKNTIYIRDIKSVSKLVKESPPFSILGLTI